MKALYTLPFAAIFFLISCDNTSSDSDFQKQLVRNDYVCENGEPLNVTYTLASQHSFSASVILKASTYELARIQSASGEKYSDGINTWWTKGEAGLLEIDNVIVLKNCLFNKPVKRMHPSWDINNDSINDCETDGSCDHTNDYSQPRKI